MTDREKYERALYLQEKAKADHARLLEASRKCWPVEFSPRARVLTFKRSKATNSEQ